MKSNRKQQLNKLLFILFLNFLFSCQNENVKYDDRGRKKYSIEGGNYGHVLYYDTIGNIKKKCKLENRIPCGLCEEYFANGKVSEKYFVKNNKVEGVYFSYDTNGFIVEKRKYFDNSVNGYALRYNNEVLNDITLFYKSNSYMYYEKGEKNDYFIIDMEDTVNYGSEYTIKFDFTNYPGTKNIEFFKGKIYEKPSGAFYCKEYKLFKPVENNLIMKNLAYFRGVNILEGIIFIEKKFADTTNIITYPIFEQFYVK